MEKLAALAARRTGVLASAPSFQRAFLPISRSFASQSLEKFEQQPTDSEQATGFEKIEMDKGVQYWDSVVRGPFGTAENPVLVESVNNERVVGCPGECAPGIDGELRWFIVRKDAPYTCPDCGQVFKLKHLGH